MDRWNLLPALFAALGIVVAVMPPVGPEAPSLRVEQILPVGPAHAALLRIARITTAYRIERPSRLRITVNGRAPGDAGVVHAPSALRSPFEYVTLPAANAATNARTIHIASDDLHARFELLAPAHPLGRSPPNTPPPLAPQALSNGRAVEVFIEGGALVPEIDSDLWIRVSDPSVRTLDAIAEGSAFSVVPATIMLDACRVARVRTSLRGFDASLAVRDHETQRELARVQVPVRVDGIAVHRLDEHRVRLARAGPETTVLVVVGDATGPSRWLPVTLAARDDGASADLGVRADESWLVTSTTHDLSSTQGLWLTPPPHACSHSPLGLDFARIATTPPSNFAIATVFDGPRRAREERDRQRDAVRLAALAVACTALAFLSARLAHAGLKKNTTELAAYEWSRRRRALRVALFASLFALVGVALAAAFFLQVR